jgi:hypothetical protein
LVPILFQEKRLPNSRQEEKFPRQFQLNLRLLVISRLSHYPHLHTYSHRLFLLLLFHQLNPALRYQNKDQCQSPLPCLLQTKASLLCLLQTKAPLPLLLQLPPLGPQQKPASPLLKPRQSRSSH